MKLQSTFEFCKNINGQGWIITIETYKTVKYVIAQRCGWAFPSYCERLSLKENAITYITKLIENNK